MMRVILLFLLSFGASAEVTEERIEDLEEILNRVYQSEIAEKQQKEQEEEAQIQIMEKLSEKLQKCVFEEEEESFLDNLIPASFKDPKCDTTIEEAKEAGISYDQIKDIMDSDDFTVVEKVEEKRTVAKP